MNEKEKIRDEVSKNYAALVAKPGSSCCGPAPATNSKVKSSCCGASVEPATGKQKGVAAKIAGYTSDQLEALPESAVVNSFGCGNPLAFSEVKPGQTVLDLGSGAGIDLLIAAKKVGPKGKVIGVDMTDEMIARARENIAESGLKNIEVRKGIIEELPVESGTVDWVISNCVINLSPEKEKVFAEIHRVLKPGGTMMVSDIVVKDLPEYLRKNAQLYSACVSGAISEDDYVAGLEKAGLKDVKVLERLKYDTSQIEAIFRSELDAEGKFDTCDSAKKLLTSAINTLAENVWSAKFSATK